MIWSGCSSSRWRPASTYYRKLFTDMEVYLACTDGPAQAARFREVFCHHGALDCDTLPPVCPATCGDGKAELTEACDGNDLRGRKCFDHGFDAGTLACKPDCTYDLSACTQDTGTGTSTTGQEPAPVPTPTSGPDVPTLGEDSASSPRARARGGLRARALRPLASGEPEPEPEPEPCRDVAVGDACLVRSSFQLPGPYRFLGRGDSDGDGQDELIAFSYGFQACAILSFSLPSQQEDPRFQALLVFQDHGIYRPVLLDFDGEGRTDFAGATDFWYFSGGDIQTGDLRTISWRNRGEFQFEKASVNYSESPPTLAAGDIDGDGRTDLFGMGFRANGFVQAYDPETNAIEEISLPDFTVLQMTGEPQLAAADHNGDAYADFVLLDGSGRAWWIVGGPDYQLTLRNPEAPVVLTPESQSFYARDLDGDGLVDLMAARVTYPSKEPLHTISLALGQPGGGFAALTSFDAAHEVTSAGIDWHFSIPKFAHMEFRPRRQRQARPRVCTRRAARTHRPPTHHRDPR